MLQSKQVELAIYRYVNVQSAERSTLITPLAQAVGSRISLVMERLRWLNSEGYIKLSKNIVAMVRRRTYVPRLRARADPQVLCIPYSEEGNMPQAFFTEGDFIIEITPSGRSYFERLEEEASAERQKLGERILEKLDEESGVALTIARITEVLPELSRLPEAERLEILKSLKRDGHLSYIHPEGPLTITNQGRQKAQWARELKVNLERREVIMGDKYEAHGQVGAMGPNAHVHDANFVQLWDQTRQSIDLGKLASELARLREVMRARGTAAEHDAATGAVASAELEAKKGHGAQALEHLAKAGKWALDCAREAGVQVAAEALKRACGL